MELSISTLKPKTTEKEFVSCAIISKDGYFFEKVKEDDLIKWLDNFYKTKLNGRSLQYSTYIWNEMKKYNIHLDGKSYKLLTFNKQLFEKYF